MPLTGESAVGRALSGTLDVVDDALAADEAEKALGGFLEGTKYAKYARFVLSVLGVLPWVGPFLSAGGAYWAEGEQGRVNLMLQQWLQEHAAKIDSLRDTLVVMMNRLEQLGDVAEERLKDEKYLGLVRFGFRVWDEAESQEKRDRVRKTLTHAAASRICNDDVVRLFLTWLRTYDDLHMQIVRVLYQNPGATRAFIWEQIHGEYAREDSAEADLYRLMIFDLNTGRVLRQQRETDAYGRFVRARQKPRGRRPTHLESAFEDEKPYVLTELGSQFVHYAMTELVPRIAGPGQDGT